ncbi:MAG: HAD family phosphatase [Clostridia bacterium]|nr:HAD family phosphatase [Clostridia bacterium]
MIRMIVSDIDGTLMPIGGRMSPRTLDTIRRCAEAGILFVLASGRTFLNTARVALDAGLDCPVISANGGRADAHPWESPIYEDRMEKETARRVCDRLLRAGCFMTSYVGTKVYTLPETNGYGSLCCRVSEAKKGEAFAVESDRLIMKTEGVKGPYKFEAYSDDKALIDELRSEFISWGMSVSSAFPYNLEILPPGGGKGKAVKELAARFGVQKEEIMALGDGSNDVGLLLSAGVRVAMENAVDSLKAVSTHIAPHVDKDGAAFMIEQIALGENA